MVVIHKKGKTAAGTSTNGIKFKIHGLVFLKEYFSQMYIACKPMCIACKPIHARCYGRCRGKPQPRKINVKENKLASAKCQRRVNLSWCCRVQGWQW